VIPLPSPESFSVFLKQNVQKILRATFIEQNIQIKNIQNYNLNYLVNTLKEATYLWGEGK
jgi:hypothetical protein